jgi:hypothetical protein
MSCVSFRQHQSLIFFLPRQPKEHEFPMGRRGPIVTIGKCRGSGFAMSALGHLRTPCHALYEAVMRSEADIGQPTRG